MSYSEQIRKIKKRLKFDGQIALNGNALEKARKAKDYTQEEVAEKSGVDLYIIKALECQPHLNIELAEKLCTCLDIQPEEILMSTVSSEPFLELFHRVPDGPIPFNSKEFGNRLQQLRKDRGLSLMKAAEGLPYSHTQISKIEKATAQKRKEKIDIKEAITFADFYKCTVAYLLGFTDKEFGTTPDKVSPFVPFPEEERSFFAAAAQAYHRDPALWTTIINLMKGLKEQRDFYLHFLQVLQEYLPPTPSPVASSDKPVSPLK